MKCAGAAILCATHSCYAVRIAGKIVIDLIVIDRSHPGMNNDSSNFSISGRWNSVLIREHLLIVEVFLLRKFTCNLHFARKQLVLLTLLYLC